MKAKEEFPLLVLGKIAEIKGDLSAGRIPEWHRVAYEKDFYNIFSISGEIVVQRQTELPSGLIVLFEYRYSPSEEISPKEPVNFGPAIEEAVGNFYRSSVPYAYLGESSEVVYVEKSDFGTFTKSFDSVESAKSSAHETAEELLAYFKNHPSISLEELRKRFLFAIAELEGSIVRASEGV